MAADHRVKVIGEADRTHVAGNKCDVAEPHLVHPCPSDVQDSWVAIDTYDAALRPNQSSGHYRYVTGPGADIQDLHCRGEAGVLQETTGERLLELTSPHQCLGLLRRATQHVGSVRSVTRTHAFPGRSIYFVGYLIRAA